MKRSTLRHVTLAAFAAGATAIGVPSADAINIVLNFNAGASQNPSFDSTGAGLQSIMNHVRTFYNNTFLDTHTLTVNYWWEDLTGTTLGLHTLVSQSGGRQTVANIRFDTRVGTGGAERLWYIDPDPTDNSEYDMQQTLWRDLTATQRTNWYNAGANIPDTFEVGYTGAALATAPNAAQNGFDLLSVAMHEVGHALGMSAANVSTQAETQDGDYDFNSNFVFNRTLAARTASSTNIAHLAANPAVMFPSFNTGQRKLPGDTDLFSMAAGHSYNLVATPRREFYGGSNWNTPGNWSGNRVPGVGTDAFVRNPGSLVTMSLSANGAARDLFVGEGAWVTTNTNTLFIFGEGMIDGSNAGAASTRIRVSSGGTLSASRLTAVNSGILTMLGGRASVGTLNLTTTGSIDGSGSVNISGRLNNNGTITASGGNLLVFTTGSGVLDLDGFTTIFGPEPGTLNATGGDLTFTGSISDNFNGTANISATRTLELTNGWTLGGLGLFSSPGVLNFNTGTNTASAGTLAAAFSNINGIVNVNGYGRITSNMNFGSTAMVNVTGSGTLRLDGAATFNGGSFTGAGRLILDDSVVIAADTTIAVNELDWDGFIPLAPFTVNSGVTATINSNIITDAYSGTLNLNGTLAVNPLFPWGLDGTLNINSGTMSGTEVTISGSVNTGPGTSRIQNSVTFTSAASVSVPAGRTLSLDGISTFSGGAYTGAGTLRFDGIQQVFAANTTINVATLDMDGLSTTNHVIVRPNVTATINSNQIDVGGDAFDAQLTLQSGTMAINTAAAWSNRGNVTLAHFGTGTPLLTGAGINNLSAGTINFTSNVGGSGSLAGGRISTNVNNSGRINVNAASNIFGATTFNASSSVVVAADQNLSLDGPITYLGGSYTGAGMITQNGDAVVAANTKIDVATYDWDGLAVTDTTVNPGVEFMINSLAIENPLHNPGHDGTITINSGTVTVNTPGGWEKNAVLALNNITGAVPTVAGQPMFFNDGTLISSGASQVTAAMIQGGSATVNVLNSTLLQSGTFGSLAGQALVKTGAGTWNITGQQSHAANARLVMNAGTVIMHANAGGGGQNLSIDVTRSTLVLNTRQHLQSLNVNLLGVVRMPPAGAVVNTRSLFILGGTSPQGRVDIFRNGMVVDYTGPSPLNDIRDWIVAGYAGGAWTGQGIMSSEADASQFGVGYAESSAIFSSFPATFLGESVDDSAVLIRFTRYGDANLDGQVNLADFNRLAANFGSINAVWSQGDFNYDGIVNLMDFNRLAANFGLSASGTDAPSPDDWATLLAAVPEPSSALWLAAVVPLLCRGRRSMRSA